MKTDLFIIGAGGLGREVAATIKSLGFWKSVCFIDDNIQPNTKVNGLPVVGNLSYLLKVDRRVDVHIAIGVPAIRKSVLDTISVNANLQFPNIIHPSVRIHDETHVRLGRGNYLADGTIITTNVTLSDFNLINLMCTIGHDTVIGSNCSVMPSVNISGGAKLEDNVYVGTGVKLIKSTVLGEGCTVGAGAVVNKDIPAGETWAGVPAKKI